MAFTSFTGSRSYIKYADHDEGDVLVTGFYVGEETSKFKNQLYVFRSVEDDNVVCLNAAGKLTKFINEKAQEGDLCRIIYKGKKVITGGQMAGKEAHDFDCQIDLDHRKRFQEAKAGKTPAPEVKKSVSSSVFESACEDGTL